MVPEHASSCSSKAPSPSPCARLRYTRAANPIQGLLGYGSLGEAKHLPTPFKDQEGLQWPT